MLGVLVSAFEIESKSVLKISQMVFLRMAQVPTHTKKHRSWMLPKGDVEVRQLLYRGCHKVKSLGRCDADTAAEDSRSRNIKCKLQLHCSS